MDTQEQITIGDVTYTLAYADAGPPLSSELYEALKESIAKNGIQTPILVGADNHVLDGHNRLRIAAELELDPEDVPVEEHSLSGDEDELYWAAVKLNTARRQVATPKQRRRWLVQLRKACKQRGLEFPSSHEIADHLTVSHTTILRDLRALDAANDEELEHARKRKSETQLRVTYVKKVVRWLEDDSTEVAEGLDISAATAALQRLLERAKEERDRASEQYKRLTEERQEYETGEPQSEANDEPASADESAGEERSGERGGDPEDTNAQPGTSPEDKTVEPTQIDTSRTDGGPEPTAHSKEPETPATETPQASQRLSSGEGSKSADSEEMSDVGAEYIKEIESYAAGAGGET